MGKKNRAILPILAPTAFSTTLWTWGVWLATAWTLWVSYVYLQSYPLANVEHLITSWIPQDWPTAAVLKIYLANFSVAAILWAGAVSLGAWELRGVRGFSALGRLALAGTLGLATLSYLFFALGVVNLYKNSTFVVLLGLLTLFAIISWPTRIQPLLGDAKSELGRILHKTPSLFVLAFIFLCGIAFMMALVPELFYDSLVYHLGVPRWYLSMGGIFSFPNLHSNYPLTVQLLYLPGLALTGETAAKLMHWFCGVLLTTAMLGWAYEENVLEGALWAPVAFLSMPVCQQNWWTSGVDIGVTLFGFTSVWCWVRSLSLEPGAARRPLLILSGLLAGLCMSSKLTGGLVLPVLLLLHLYLAGFRRKQFRTAVQDCLWIGCAGILPILPWFTKAYLYTGNPVFPFFGRFFKGLDENRMATFYSESNGVTPTSFWGWITFPWQFTFQGNSGYSFVGPVLLAWLPLTALGLIVHKATRKKSAALIAFALLGCLGISFVNRIARYWLPYLSVLFMGIGLGTFEWVGTSKKFRTALQLMTLVPVALNLLYGLQTINTSYDPWRVLIGKETAVEFQSYTHPGMNPYPADVLFDWAKRNIPAKSRILFIGDEKVANCEVPFLAAGVYDVALPVRWTAHGENSEALYERFRKEDLTHILVNPYEGLRLAGYGILNWPDKTWEAFNQFWKDHVRLVHVEAIPERLMGQKPPVMLYVILPKEIAAQMPVPQNTPEAVHEMYLKRKP